MKKINVRPDAATGTTTAKKKQIVYVVTIDDVVDFKVYPIWNIVKKVDKDVAKKIEDYILNEYLK